MIDWLLSRDWPLTFQVLRDFAAALAAFAGFTAIWRWQSELIGKDQYEMAKKICSAAYQYTTKLTSRASVKGLDFSLVKPETMNTLRSKIRDKWLDRPSDIWELLAELRNLQWQSSVLGMPGFDAQITGLENAEQNLFIAHFDFYLMVINESPEANSIEARLTKIKEGVAISLKEADLNREQILDVQRPFILKSFWSVIRRKRLKSEARK